MVRIHPGQSMYIPGFTSLRLLLWVVLLGAFPGFGYPTVGGQAPPPDSTDLHRQARRAQRDFEALHRRNLPVTLRRPLGRCDEYVGRLCLSDGDSDWEPLPDDSLVQAAREDLVSLLGRVRTIHPGNHWVLGQLVRYLGSTGEWDRAERATRGCRHPRPWWCPALRGYVLHRSGRVGDALLAFDEAVALMAPDKVREWRDPSDLVGYPIEDWLRRPPDMAPEAALDRFWMLADPLFLTPGNEGLSEHYARRFAPELFDGTEITMGMPWGRAFEELLVRYGFIAGWERVPAGATSTGTGSVVQHHHPESRGLLPPFEALTDPAGLPPGLWTPVDKHPKNAMAPVQAPLVAHGLGQVATFRRNGDLLVLASYGVPEDTLFANRRPAPVADGEELLRRPPWEPPVDGLTNDTLSGLFLLPDTGGWAPLAVFGSGGEGILQLVAPPGGYLLSLEQWSPSERWGARLRRGLRVGDVPPDIPHTSDLLLLEPSAQLPTDLAQAVPLMLLADQIPSGGAVTVAWELYGLGRRGEPIQFELALAEGDPGFIRRTLGRIGLFRSEPAVRLAWDEEGSEDSAPRFRAVRVEIPTLDPGQYELHLRISLPNRTPLVLKRVITVT